jgi:Protein of unknown function (DUF2752)
MPAMPLTFSRALPGDRMRDLAVLGGLVLWLAYTRVFWALHAAHLAMPPCPFFLITGHPCPFCGGTRSFAYMWSGDLSDAVRLYPLGPLLFAGTFVAAGALATGIVASRTWTPKLTSMQWRLVWMGCVSAIGVSWLLKVFILGN